MPTTDRTPTSALAWPGGDIAYVVGIRGDITVHPHEAAPAAPAWSGTGRPPVPRYRQPPVTMAELTAAAGWDGRLQQG